MLTNVFERVGGGEQARRGNIKQMSRSKICIHVSRTQVTLAIPAQKKQHLTGLKISTLF